MMIRAQCLKCFSSVEIYSWELEIVSARALVPISPMALEPSWKLQEDGVKGGAACGYLNLLQLRSCHDEPHWVSQVHSL